MRPKRERKVYNGFYTPQTEYPVIRLGGRFLEGYGFHIGDKFDVEYQLEKITITKPESVCLKDIKRTSLQDK